MNGNELRCWLKLESPLRCVLDGLHGFQAHGVVIVSPAMLGLGLAVDKEIGRWGGLFCFEIGRSW